MGGIGTYGTGLEGKSEQAHYQFAELQKYTASLEVLFQIEYREGR